MEYAVIAAGEGSRLAREGVVYAKPLVPVGGEPLIDRLCRIFSDNQASLIHIIINEEREEVRRHVENLQHRYPIRLIIKNTPSSMHSFYELASGITEEKFCLTTVDPVFDEQEFARYIEKPLYVETDTDMNIHAFGDSATTESRYVSGGIYAFTRSVLPILKDGIETGMSRMRNFQRALIGNGLRLNAYAFSCIIDIDHASDIAKAESFINTHERPKQ